MQASESVCTENARYTKLEAPEIIRDRVVIANHQRGEPRWVEMLRGHTRDVVGRYTFDTRHEFGEIVVRQIVERDLRGRARDLLSGFKVPGVAARQCRHAQCQFVS